MIRRILAVAAVQLVLVAVAVAPQLSARFGDEYRLRVAPLDPIDPFRGAYVALRYPDLHPPGDTSQSPIGALDGTGPRGDVYIPLKRSGEVWVAADWTRTRPTDGPYLTCADRAWSIDCGIDSWFASQTTARTLEHSVRGGTAVAVLRIDSRGHAALVGIEAAG